jgi:hypothetical protein
VTETYLPLQGRRRVRSWRYRKTEQQLSLFPNFPILGGYDRTSTTGGMFPLALKMLIRGKPIMALAATEGGVIPLSNSGTDIKLYSMEGYTGRQVTPLIVNG